MATQAYWDWINNGRHWQLAKPIDGMVTIARRHGIAVLGTIGNDDHLMSSYPEDHTPFSYTAEPVPANGWVCACDLENSQGLGDAILRDARAGKLPWLKYMNFGNLQYGHWDGFRNGEWNSDEHIHLSCFTDKVNLSLGNYDPLSVATEDEVEINTLVPQAFTDDNKSRSVGDILGDLWKGVHVRIQNMEKTVNTTQAVVAELKARPAPTPGNVDPKALAEALKPYITAMVVEALEGTRLTKKP